MHRDVRLIPTNIEKCDTAYASYGRVPRAEMVKIRNDHVKRREAAGQRQEEITTMEDMKLNALSLTQRVPMHDTRAIQKTPKVKVPKAITAKVEANTISTKNQPKSTLFLKEPKSLEEMMQTAPHTFGGPEKQELILQLFHSYQTSNFEEE